MANPFKNSQLLATLAWTGPNSQFLDWYAYWLTVTDGVAATLVNAMTATDLTFHVAQIKPAANVATNQVALQTSAGIRSTVTPAVIPTIAVGAVVVIDSEPMTVTNVAVTSGQPANGYDVTVLRGVQQTKKYALAVAVAHVANSNVSVLSYVSPEYWLFKTAVQPALDKARTDLGDKSATQQFDVSVSLAAAP